MVKSRKWILQTAYDGAVKASNFKLVEEDLPALNDGEFICEAVFLTVDPYMRAHGSAVGEVISGSQVARVTQSKNKNFPEGQLVMAYAGWRDRTLVKPDQLKQLMLYPVKGLGDLSPSLLLGCLGMPGMTALFGFLDLCQPKEGDTVLVNGAAGAVGSLVGQIAKIKGCTVIGFAGTEDKCAWLKTLGFDHVFNYKKVDVDDSLTKAAPNGVNCFFDNIGGEFTSKALQHMSQFGRVAVCGSISSYNNSKGEPLLPFPFRTILGKELRIEGFIVTKWLARFPEGRVQMQTWIVEGKLKYKETIREGFENMPKTFMELFTGGNIGKMIVKV